MCGFFFVVQRREPVDPKQFEKSLSLTRHRGPDSSKTSLYSIEGDAHTPTLHVGAGFNRLSILDLHHRSDQPFQRGGCTLLYNGEIYNYQALRDGFRQRGSTFTTTGDTEVLFQSLILDGLRGLETFNGMWSFCFQNGHEIHAARDRFGKKPLFYHFGSDVFCCGSNIAGILTYLGMPFAFRSDSLLPYLAHGGCWPSKSSETHVENVDQIPAGHTISVDLHKWTLSWRKYFDVTALEPPTEQDIDSLGDTFLDGTKLRLISDRPVGLLLSGGIDSGLILSALHKSGFLEGVRCFIGETGKSEDAAYAKQAADKLGIAPTILEMPYEESSFERFLQMCRHHEKPFPLIGNAMGMASLYEAVAGEGITVAIDGTGGDEFFGGYWRRYFRFAALDAVKNWDLIWLARMGVNGNLGKVLNSLERERQKKKEETRAAVPYASVSSLSPDPLRDFTGSIGDASALDCAPGGRLGEWLWHNDRNAMMFSIENRSPFLDYRLATFTRAPYSQKFSGRWNKRLLRRLFDRFSPIPTQWRHRKQGFRWDRNRFADTNSGRIIELIASSKILSSALDSKTAVNDIHAGRLSMHSRVTHRLLLIAAVEHAMER
jgi:asparagine synthase (glutamine-hydrolysing)